MLENNVTKLNKHIKLYKIILHIYACIFKGLILGTPGNKRRTVKNKRDADDFCKGRIRQLIYSKYGRGEMYAIK
jgi:hypothetical protein